MNQQQRIIHQLYEVYHRSDRLEPVGDLLRSLPVDSVDDIIHSIANLVVGKQLSSETVKQFNLVQKSPAFHPYTCPNRGEDGHSTEGVLVATAYGLVCTECNYTQDLTDLEAKARIQTVHMIESMLNTILGDSGDNNE
jgi:hypothetical protein